MKKMYKQYDLEDRTFKFASDCRILIRQISKDICNYEDLKQLTRSSGSVGANYIEANESLSKKDFKMRIKISRKESKESRYWLSLLFINNSKLEKDRAVLVTEATEIMNIFGAILRNSK